jgi:hypothetical protein
MRGALPLHGMMLGHRPIDILVLPLVRTGLNFVIHTTAPFHFVNKSRKVYCLLVRRKVSTLAVQADVVRGT